MTLVCSAGVALTLYQWSTGSSIIGDVHAEGPPPPSEDLQSQSNVKLAPPEKVEPIFEEQKISEGASKDETRDQISSQHLQVKKSWENPGVWCWGDNNGKVAGPDAKEGIVKAPRWMPNFDGKILRDLQLSRTFGAAISEEGDLLQWGTAYSETGSATRSSQTSAKQPQDPVVTLKGKNLTHLAISKDRILALSSSGTVYSLSVSQEEQLQGPKPLESSWYLPFWSSRSPISYRNLTPSNLGWNERIKSISSGLDHALLLTSSGRVFSAASGSEEYPTRGQMGVPGLTWFSRPANQPYDTPQEVPGLHDFKVKQISCGDFHSVALDRQGRVFAWGDNQRGQLGIGDTSREATFFDSPVLLPITRLYAGSAQRPRVTGIHAGGNTTFLTVDAERMPQPTDEDPSGATVGAHFRGYGRVTADVWACGHGIWGQLGNGRWTHVQALPTKILPLSGLFEYDERARRAVPIRIRAISVGAGHCAATMDNVTYTSATSDTSGLETNWGADVLFFGNNEFYQLGTGRRNNVVVPTYVQPMDRVAEVREGGRAKGEVHRFHATPRSTVWVGGRWRTFEQRVVCGRGVSAVYSGC